MLSSRATRAVVSQSWNAIFLEPWVDWGAGFGLVDSLRYPSHMHLCLVFEGMLRGGSGGSDQGKERYWHQDLMQKLPRSQGDKEWNILWIFCDNIFWYFPNFMACKPS